MPLDRRTPIVGAYQQFMVDLRVRRETLRRRRAAAGGWIDLLANLQSVSADVSTQIWEAVRDGEALRSLR